MDLVNTNLFRLVLHGSACVIDQLGPDAFGLLHNTTIESGAGFEPISWIYTDATHWGFDTVKAVLDVVQSGSFSHG